MTVLHEKLIVKAMAARKAVRTIEEEHARRPPTTPLLAADLAALRKAQEAYAVAAMSAAVDIDDQMTVVTRPGAASAQLRQQLSNVYDTQRLIDLEGDQSDGRLY